jgi:hypothetical protein
MRRSLPYLRPRVLPPSPTLQKKRTSLAEHGEGTPFFVRTCSSGRRTLANARTHTRIHFPPRPSAKKTHKMLQSVTQWIDANLTQDDAGCSPLQWVDQSHACSLRSLPPPLPTTAVRIKGAKDGRRKKK